jgi:hypothetical protein
MIIPPIGPSSRKLDTIQNARIAAYSDDHCTCKPNASMQAMRQLLET